MSLRAILHSAMCATMLATSVLAQSCFVDNLPKPSESQAYDAQMRALMMAHIPIEYRNSCGLLDDTDQAYFEAIRAQVGCEESEGYQKFFGPYLGEAENYLFAVKRTDLRSDEDFDTYCEIVERIDLSAVVGEDGQVNVQMLQAQVPLFQALQNLVAERRWDQ